MGIQAVNKVPHAPSVEAEQKAERAYLSKWERAKLPAKAYHANPSEAKQLIDLHMHHQIAAFGHEVKITSNGHLEILCNGSYQPVEQVVGHLKAKENAFVSTKDETEWNYLPDSGLTPWKLLEWTTLDSVAKLGKEELETVQKRAQKLSSPLMKQDGGPKYVLQIVSSWYEPKFAHNGALGNVDAMVMQPQHPWIRLITPEGNVHIVGFNWGKALTYSNIFETVTAHLKSPDPVEAVPCISRIVTSIQIDESQFKEIKSDVEEINKNGIAFNFVKQNCTTFIDHIFKKIGMDVKLHMNSKELIWNCLPNPVQNIFSAIAAPCKKVAEVAGDIFKMLTPPIVRKAAKAVSDAVGSVFASLYNVPKNALLMAFGANRGVCGHEVGNGFFNRVTNMPQELKKYKAVRMISDVKHFFMNNLSEIFLPRKLVEWQMLQPSTTHVDGREFNRFRQQFTPVVRTHKREFPENQEMYRFALEEKK